MKTLPSLLLMLSFFSPLGAMAADAGLDACYARYEAPRFTIGNDCVERSWLLCEGRLHPEKFSDSRTGQHVSFATTAPALGNTCKARLQVDRGKASVVEAPSLCATLIINCAENPLTYYFKIFPGLPGIQIQLDAALDANPDTVILESWPLPGREWGLTAVTLQDRTDRKGKGLAAEKHFDALEKENLSLKGNLFFVENEAQNAGLIFYKHAPLPDSRPLKSKADLCWRAATRTLEFRGRGAAYPWAVLAYTGGEAGRIATLQAYDRALRLYLPGRDGILLSNTWGDRNKDGRICEAFILQEIEAGKRLGVDVVQIDDGWEKGRTKNSVEASEVWGGFWAADEAFWTTDAKRFPKGLKPLVTKAAGYGMKLGLWYGPDSAQDAINAEKDTKRILAIHRQEGIDYFKLDAVEMESRLGERRLHDFLRTVQAESQGKVIFDFDITAMTRPSYFDLNAVGTLFVHNRYTDYENPETRSNAYWPHKVLRNVWQLAHYMTPARLRMQFLNNTRNPDKYGDHPLAPIHYSPDYLFASVMCTSPLAWCEVSNLPEPFVEAVAPLIALWKEHREALHTGAIIPIGEEPTGASWTGFCSVQAGGKAGYGLVFREDHPEDVFRFTPPLLTGKIKHIEQLAGNGAVRVDQNQVVVALPEEKQFAFFKIAMAE